MKLYRSFFIDDVYIKRAVINKDLKIEHHGHVTKLMNNVYLHRYLDTNVITAGPFRTLNTIQTSMNKLLSFYKFVIPVSIAFDENIEANKKNIISGHEFFRIYNDR